MVVAHNGLVTGFVGCPAASISQTQKPAIWEPFLTPLQQSPEGWACLTSFDERRAKWRSANQARVVL